MHGKPCRVVSVYSTQGAISSWNRYGSTCIIFTCHLNKEGWVKITNCTATADGAATGAGLTATADGAVGSAGHCATVDA